MQTDHCLCYTLSGENDSESFYMLIDFLDIVFVAAQAGLKITRSCADPESFVRGGPTLTRFFS